LNEESKPRDGVRSVLIGVFTGSKQVTCRYHPERFSDHFAGNAATGELSGCIYFFTLHDIDYQNCRIEGIYFNHSNGRWMNRLFPFPDVLYQRDGVAEHRKRELARFQNTIKACKMRLVNSLAEFDKWAVQRDLNNYSELKQYLPETRLYQKYGKDLEIMLRQYGRVYLKACRGRQGRQVVQVTRLPGGSYEYRYFIKKLKCGTVNLLGSLVTIMEKFFNGQDFIIQQPLDLIEFTGRKAD
jgi:hypothetical protein